MGLPVPQLDDRTFDDLVAEARALIPAVAPDWTDHNASDPGIALVELFAWVAEMLIYRADQVPASHLDAFLRLLNGPDWQPGAHQEDDIQATIAQLRDEWRAVTGADFERLAVRASADVLRARAIAGRDLSPTAAAARLEPHPAHVSVMLLLVAGAEPRADDVAADVAAFLEPRRLVTTRVVVTEPLWTPVSVELLLARPADVPEALTAAAVETAVAAFLDARTGGPAGDGWRWGRAIYPSEVTAVIDGLPEVDHLVDLTLETTCPGNAPRCVAAAPVLRDDGSLVAMRLDDACLPGPEPATVSCASGDDFVPVTATVPIVPKPTVAPDALPALRAQVARAVRDLAWPGRGWPPPGDSVLEADRIAATARGVKGVKSVGTVELRAAARYLHETAQHVPYVEVDSRELIELAVQVVDA